VLSPAQTAPVEKQRKY